MKTDLHIRAKMAIRRFDIAIDGYNQALADRDQDALTSAVAEYRAAKNESELIGRLLNEEANTLQATLDEWEITQ